MELIELIQTGAKLKAELDAIQLKLRDVNQEIYEKTTFVDGKNTVNTKAGSITAKIQKKETYAWDQAKLDAARNIIGDAKFMEIFAFKWKESSKKTLDGFLANAPDEQKKPVLAALTIKPSYSVSYEVQDV